MVWQSELSKLLNLELRNTSISGTIQTKLSRFLFHYRLTPRTKIGVAPAELLLKQRSRSHLDFALLNIKDKRLQQLD